LDEETIEMMIRIEELIDSRSEGMKNETL